MVLLSCKDIDIFSYFKQKTVFCLILLHVFAPAAMAQGLNARFLAYIEQFKEVAMEHCRTHGIPASITLAQGLLESNAGSSYLASRGNNHFGIKCHRWSGEAVEYDDTLQHDCYRKYGSPEDSYLDHSRFLRGKRYTPLHSLDTTDYRGWAHGLRTCGYAEDPDYPQKLISIIERYTLHRYDSIAIAAPAPPVKGKEDARHKNRKEDAKKNREDAKQNGAVPPPPKKHKRDQAAVPPPHPKVQQESPSRDSAQPASTGESKRRTMVEQDPQGKSSGKTAQAKRQRNSRTVMSGKPLTGNADNDD